MRGSFFPSGNRQNHSLSSFRAGMYLEAISVFLIASKCLLPFQRIGRSKDHFSCRLPLLSTSQLTCDKRQAPSSFPKSLHVRALRQGWGLSALCEWNSPSSSELQELKVRENFPYKCGSLEKVYPLPVGNTFCGSSCFGVSNCWPRTRPNFSPWRLVFFSNTRKQMCYFRHSKKSSKLHSGTGRRKYPCSYCCVCAS